MHARVPKEKFNVKYEQHSMAMMMKMDIYWEAYLVVVPVP